MSSADMSSGPPQTTCHLTCREDMKTCREDIDDILSICRPEVRRHVFMRRHVATCRRHVVWSWSYQPSAAAPRPRRYHHHHDQLACSWYIVDSALPTPHRYISAECLSSLLDSVVCCPRRLRAVNVVSFVQAFMSSVHRCISLFGIGRQINSQTPTPKRGRPYLFRGKTWYDRSVRRSGAAKGGAAGGRPCHCFISTGPI